MSKKSKKTKKKATKAQLKQRRGASQPEDYQQAAESRSAVAANVAWMLSLMSTVTAEAIGLCCRWYTSFVEHVDLLKVLSGIMLLVAFVSGLVTLALIPIVLKFNKLRPPAIVLQTALLAGGLPIIVVVAQYFSGR